MINFRKLNIETNGRTAGKIKTYCPKCRDSRKNKRDKSLSVDIDTGLYHCHYCGWKGCAREKPEYARPAFAPLPVAEHQPLTAELSGWLSQVRAIPPATAAELGITASLQFMPQSGRKEWCICFNYYEKGMLVNTKFRTLQKQFKLVAGAEMIPYNIDAILHTPECVITEGEIDVLSFHAAGRKDVVSVPGGANKNLTWMDRFAQSHFEDKRVIYIAVDTDAKGTELRAELVRRLGAERCRLVGYGPGCKDANDLLKAHGPQSLLQALDQAPEIPLEGVFSVADVADDLRTLFENGLEHGAESGLANLDRLCTFETGRLCVVTGIPGCGKSEFVDELVVRLILRHEWRAAFFSPENMPLPLHLCKLIEKLTGRHFKPPMFTEQLYAYATRWLERNVSSIFPEDNFTADNILAKARELVSRRGIRILVIDPMNRLEHQIPAGQTETQYLSALLDKITNFAQRNQCLVILVTHPTKMKREPGATKDPVPTLYHINGSAAFFNKCDFGLVVERDRTAGVTRLHVEKVKFRHLGNVGVASFVYNTTGGRYSPCQETEEGKAINAEFDNSVWGQEQEPPQEKELFEGG